MPFSRGYFGAVEHELGLHPADIPWSYYWCPYHGYTTFKVFNSKATPYCIYCTRNAEASNDAQN